MSSSDLSLPSSQSSSSPQTSPQKLTIQLGFDGENYIIGENGPLKEPLTPQRTKRLAEAVGQTIILRSTDPYFPPTKAEKAAELKQELEKELGFELMVKGSWTIPDAKPNDLDLSTWVCYSQPGDEWKLRQKILSVLIDRVNRVATGTYWVPLGAYLKETIIYDWAGRTATIIYKGTGLDLTFHFYSDRMSRGLADGRWWSAGLEPMEMNSKGKTFITEKADAKKAAELIRHHLNIYDDPASIHNFHLGFAYDILRLGIMSDDSAARAAIDSLYRERSAETLGQKFANFKQDHLHSDESHALMILIYYTMHAFNPHMCAFITEGWQKSCHLQKIEVMDPYCNVIRSHPYLIPHVLAVFRWILLAEGAEAYSFSFNTPENPLRPLLGIKVGDTTNYLLLPLNGSTPIQLGRQFLRSRALLLEFDPDCRHLTFLKPIFRWLKLSGDYLSRSYNFSEMRAFYEGDRAQKLQALFGPYPEARSFLQEVPEASKAVVPSNATPSSTPVELSSIFASLVASSTAVVKSGSKGTAALSPPLLQLMANGVDKATPTLALLPPKEEKKESKQESLSTPDELPKSIGTDLQSAKTLADKYQIEWLHVVIAQIEQLMKIEQAGEQKTKEVYAMIAEVMQKSEQILANADIGRQLGPNYYKEFLNQHFMLILEKGLAHPTPELFKLTFEFYSSWTQHLTESVEQEAVLWLIKTWMKLNPQKDTPLHNQGKELITIAFKKNITGDKATFDAAFDVLSASSNPVHLRVAFTGLNQLLLNLGQQKDPKVPQRIIVLLTTILMNQDEKIKDLYRPLFRTLLKLFTYDPEGFDIALKSAKALILPGLMDAIQFAIGQLKYNGDERLLFKTLNCLQKYHTATSIKLAVQAFDALLKKGQTTGFQGFSLHQLELLGSLACSLIKPDESLNAKIEWKDDPVKGRWLSLALRLQAVTNEEAEAYEVSETNRFQAHASKLMEHFKASWTDKVVQEKISALTPQKITVIKKEEEKAPKETIHKVVLVADLLLKDLESPAAGKETKRGITRILERSKLLLGTMQKETFGKELHAQMNGRILQIHCLLSKEQHPELAPLLHEIFKTASSQGLLNADKAPYLHWVINCYLRNRDRNFDFVQMKKLVDMTVELYTMKGVKSRKNAIEGIFEVFKVLYTRFPDQQLNVKLPFSPMELVQEYLNLMKSEEKRDYGLLITFMEALSLKPDPANYKRLFVHLEALVKITLNEAKRKVLIRIIKVMMNHVSVDKDLIPDEFYRFALTLLSSNYNPNANPGSLKSQLPELPMRTKLEVLALLCLREEHIVKVRKELITMQNTPDSAANLHRNVVQFNQAKLKSGKFIQAHKKFLSIYSLTVLDQPTDQKKEILIIMVKYILYMNDQVSLAYFFKIYDKEILVETIDSPIGAVNFLQYFKTVPLKDLKDSTLLCFRKAMEFCKDSNTFEVQQVVQEASKIALAHMKSMEMVLVSDDLISLSYLIHINHDSTIPLEGTALFAMIESFFMPLAYFFPERARAVIPIFLKKLLALMSGNMMLCAQLFQLFDKYHIYNQKSGVPLPVNLSEEEQEKINAERFESIKNIVRNRLQFIWHSLSKEIYNNEDNFPLLSLMRRLSNFSDAQCADLATFHLHLGDSLVNQMLFTFSSKDIKRFFHELCAFIEDTLARAKQAEELKNKSVVSVALSLTQGGVFYYGFMLNLIKKMVFLPQLYALLDDLADKNRLPVENRSNFINKEWDKYLLALTNSTKKKFPNLPPDKGLIEDPHKAVATTAMMGINAITGGKHLTRSDYSNALSERAKNLAYEVSLELLEELVQFRKRVFTGEIFSKIDYDKVEAPYRTWIQFITGNATADGEKPVQSAPLTQASAASVSAKKGNKKKKGKGKAKKTKAV